MKAFCLFAVVGVLALSAQASGVPGLINYQSRLLDDGVPADGTYSLTFRIFDDPVAAAGAPCGDPSSRCVWDETQNGVSVTKGIFNVLLGSSNPLDESVFADANRWIEIEVAGNVMSPRQRIASAAYAIKASGSDHPSIVVAASDSRIQGAADFVAEGADDQVTIQAAIDWLAPAGGEVLLLEGTYVISETIVLHADVRLVGQGAGTNIVAAPSWDPPDSPQTAMLASDATAPRTEVAHLRLTSNGDPGLFGWHGVNGSFHGRIHHNYFTGFRSNAGTVDPSGSSRNIISENVFYDCTVGYNGTDTNVQFGNIVANNSFQECIQWCVKAAWPYELTVIGNYIHSSVDGAVGIRIDGTYGDIAGGETERGRIVIANNVIKLTGSTSNGHGMQLAVAGPTERAAWGDFEKALITGNYISSNHGDAVVFHSRAAHILFRGNTVDTIADDGTVSDASAIRVGASYDAKGAPSGNIDIAGNNFYGGAAGTALELDDLGHTGIVFRDNHVYDYGKGVNIFSAGGGTAAVGTRITDNIFTNVATPVIDNGTQTVIRHNTGFATEGSGTAIVPAGSSSTVVAHGLGVTPSIRNISVTPTNDLGDATSFYVGTVTPTHFTIHTNVDPGADKATFVWQIRSDG